MNKYPLSLLFFLLPFHLLAQSTDSLHTKITTLFEQSELSGFTVSMVNANQVLFSRGYGYADKEAKISYQTDHVQIIASISKTWIGLALMQCVEQGKLSLDTDINEILSFEIKNPTFPNQPITIRQLATHTSSIIYPIPDHHKIVFEEDPNFKNFRLREKKVVRTILKNPKVEMGDYLKSYLSENGTYYNTKHFSSYAPGKRYQYSNMASTLGAHIVEIVSGMSFDHFCQKNIIEPLGLNNAAFNISNPDHSKIAKQYFGKKQKAIPLYSHNFYPTGGLRISNDDLNLFLIDIINGYQGKGKLLSTNGYATVLTPQFQEGQLPLNFPTSETNHGLFWVHDNNLIGHTGGGLGVSAFMFFDKETGIGKIFITNCELETNKKLIPPFIQIWRAMDEYSN